MCPRLVDGLNRSRWTLCSFVFVFDLVHAAVRRNLRESDTFSQIQTAYHADAADIRPRLPLVGAQIQLAARYLCVQKRRPDSVVGNFEVVRQSAFFATHASVAF